ncbi:MAG: hydrogenase maturation protease [Chloroflexi bacterium]|nr:hydrogenase maturation protease [Chloroflexota bacterium]
MILMIGYGNPLRCDDGLGQAVAQALQERVTCSAVQVQTVYQLTPELVEPVSHACLVVFIDARTEGRPGEVFVETVTPLSTNGAFTHNVTPATLLGMAYELYGAQPDGLLISIVGALFDYGTTFSVPIRQSLPAIIEQIEAIIAAHVEDHVYEDNSSA